MRRRPAEGSAVKMISRRQARSIVEALDPAEPARIAWRLANAGEDGAGISAAVGLDLTTGELATAAWPEDAEPPVHENPILVLAACSTSEREGLAAMLREGLGVTPSEEVIEETCVRSAARRGVDAGMLDRQLDQAYGDDDGEG